MNNHQQRRLPRTRGLLFGATIALALAVALLWSWNTLAADLFNAPTAKFKHALACELAIFALGLLASAGFRASPRSRGSRLHGNAHPTSVSGLADA
jgi:hypothetical protein